MVESPSSQILVVGSLNMDLTAFTPRLPFLGETVRRCSEIGGKWRAAVKAEIKLWQRLD